MLPHLIIRDPRGTWRDQEFKAYNFEALGLPTNGGALHPLLKVGRGSFAFLHVPAVHLSLQ